MNHARRFGVLVKKEDGSVGYRSLSSSEVAAAINNELDITLSILFSSLRNELWSFAARSCKVSCPLAWLSEAGYPLDRENR